ncbi:MAG: anti-sigma factor [Rhodospirillaceae bacterium]|jgi:anti-sigma factor ChrR (cupin superfamily)|nr:anti-sigma factor [Rhodospirillaceae bacterium]MBT7612219.1 anti-sigma factor [Rhodospirillaceae bacterium]
MDEGLNDDFSLSVMIDTAPMDWQASPSPTVWRKRLDRAGPAEAGRVTSVVRYDAQSRFGPHPHPDGEEILVLEGVISDHTGDYPAGSYLLNPEGFEHGPFSDDGCLLFVKLRQYPGNNRQHVLLKTAAMAWTATGEHGVEVKTLYHEAGHSEHVRLLRLDARTVLRLDDTGGIELFVMEGALEADGQTLVSGAWLRSPPGGAVALTANQESTLYLKTGHLDDV